MNTVLEVKKLKKQYKDFFLDDVSFEIEKGQIVGFVGANGAGKSTTIKSILGLIHSSCEKLEYFGSAFCKTVKNRIGVVMDDGYFYEELTVDQMKSVIAPAYDNWEDGVFYSLIDKFGINKKKKIENLSKGMKMKFAISIALAHHAELIIMDEPTSGLDPLVRNELMKLLQDIVAKEKCSILFSTHIMSDLERIADKIIFINKGKIIFDENKDKLLERYKDVLTDKENINIEDIMLYCMKGESNDI